MVPNTELTFLWCLCLYEIKERSLNEPPQSHLEKSRSDGIREWKSPLNFLLVSPFCLVPDYFGFWNLYLYCVFPIFICTEFVHVSWWDHLWHMIRFSSGVKQQASSCSNTEGSGCVEVCWDPAVAAVWGRDAADTCGKLLTTFTQHNPACVILTHCLHGVPMSPAWEPEGMAKDMFWPGKTSRGWSCPFWVATSSSLQWCPPLLSLIALPDIK